VRIVYLNPGGNLGGAETSLCAVLASIRAARPSLELWLVLGEDGPLANIARELGVQVRVQPFPPSVRRLGDTGMGRLELGWSLCAASAGTARYARELAAWLRRIRPDIVHTNGLKMHLLGAWTRPPGSSLVWHIHDYVGRRRAMRGLLRHFRHACAAVIANSNSVAKDIEAVLPSIQVTPIYNAIDLERFSPAGNKLDLDALAGLPPAAPRTMRAGLAGTFAKWKGHKVFLEALARLPEGLPVRGYIIGGPIYQTSGSQWTRLELEQEVDRLGLRGKVGFTDFIQDVPSAMRSLDMVIHASTDPEPFGMVIIEGMACGRAVIASQAGGAAELFRDGENALGHRPGDSAHLAQQILRLTNDPEYRQRIGEEGRATAERDFDRRKLAERVLALYRNNCAMPIEVRAQGAEPSPVSIAKE
jgi:glycosyltransferase involved in cell wall biosynthesis